MMPRFSLGILTILLFFISCDSSRFEGYSINKQGVEYKIHTIGEETSFQQGEVIFARFEVLTLSDSLLYSSSNPGKIPIFTDQLNQRFLQALSLLNIGDSASFILYSNELEPWLELNKREEIKLNIKPTRSLNKARYEFEQRYPELLIDYEMKEQEQLQHYLSKFKSDVLEKIGGIFLIRHHQGKGMAPSKDDLVTVHYEGFLFNGKKFDSTRDRNAPFSYKIGEQDQVIRGFDIGIRQLKKGGKATFIIPSLLAFKEGSGNGIVPPHESVIYEVELLNIEQ
jgi:FKBP-type peptidyl-prolyl cis-trans isomerase